jgi:hypothetical protein
MSVRILAPPFTLAHADAAHEAWGANCGPTSLAAILGLTLDEVRPHMKGFDAKRYTNPTMMVDALVSLGVKFAITGGHSCGKPPPWPGFGLARIQWGGPWTKAGVPVRARYRHTHWVGAGQAQDGSRGVWDINALDNGTGWCAEPMWASILVPALLSACEPKADGTWWITHAIEVSRV